MATYRADVTQTVNPAEADWRTAARAIEMQGQEISTAIKGATELFGMKKDYDVQSTMRDLELKAEEFTNSNLLAENSAPELKRLSGQRNALETAAFEQTDGTSNNVALKNLDKRLTQLKEAVNGGMPVQNFLTYVNSETKKLIAKYPGLSSEIRQRASAVTGVAGADRFYINQYVESRLNPPKSQKNVEEDLALNTIKGMEAMGLGDQQSLFTMREQDPVAYQQKVKQFNDVNLAKNNVAVVETRLKGEQLVADDNATKIKPLLGVGYTEGFKANLRLTALDEEGTALKEVAALLAAGKDPRVDPAAFDTAVKIFSASVLSAANKAKQASYEQVNTFLAGPGAKVSEATKKELFADVDRFHDTTVAEFKADSPIGVVATATILKTYANEDYNKQMQMRNLMIQTMNATDNSGLSTLYFSGGPEREKLKADYPAYYDHIHTLAQDVLNGQITAGQVGATAVKLADTLNIIKGASNTPAPVARPAHVEPKEFKAAVSAVISNSRTALDSAVKAGSLTRQERNLVQTALMTQVREGADANILARDYAQVYSKISKLPETDQSAIKASVSEESRTAMLNLNLAKSAVESKYSGVKLQFTVNDAGQIVPVSRAAATGESAQAMSDAVATDMFYSSFTGDVRTAGVQYDNAKNEFMKQKLPLLMNLVHGRAAVTGESLKTIANEYVKHLNNDTRYLGFFSLEGTTDNVKPTAASQSSAPNVTSNNNDEWWKQ